MGRVRRRLFGISIEETTIERRGFKVDNPAVKSRLEMIGRTFVNGYHAALLENGHEALARQLNSVESGLRGFAFEGAAMGLALLDYLTPWKRDRLKTFLKGPGAPHVYMVHVGAGWAMARMPWRMDRRLELMDPLFRWLAIDGFGFHEGYFHWQSSIEQCTVPVRLTGYARRAFDQGLGRCLWFVKGADVERISLSISTFAPARRADLWSGVGLACAYAGGVEQPVLLKLCKAAGDYYPQFAQGAAFAAKARLRASIMTPHTDLACEVICGMPAEAAARITDEGLENLPADSIEPSYEIWRHRIQAKFIKKRRH